MQLIKSLVEAQKAFFHTGATLSYAHRAKALKKLQRVIREREEDIFKALDADFKKPPFESYVSETGYLIKEIEHTLIHLHEWMRPERVPGTLLSFPSKSSIYKEPYGVCLVISPWNYPVQLALAPAIAAIAAGNTVIIKPSEHAPAVASLLDEMISGCFDPAFVAVVKGEVEETTALMSEPLDYVFFTGSPEVGKIIMRLAAEQLMPHTLELGGKSPCIIDKSANLSLAAKRVAQGKFFNAGQTCIAPDYVLVDHRVHDEFVEELKKCVTAFYTEEPKRSKDYARIIHQKHFNKLKAYLSNGEVAIGGEVDEGELYIAPTVMVNVDMDSALMRDEIFGPVLPVIRYSDEAEIVPFVKRYSKPLAMYHFTRNKTLKRKLREQLSFGGGAVNDTLEHLINPNLPFGGVGVSGLGAYHGKFGFDAFSHAKGVLEKSGYLDLPLKYPPYTKKLSIIRKMFKIS